MCFPGKVEKRNKEPQSFCTLAPAGSGVVDFESVLSIRDEEGSTLSPTGVRINVFDDIKAYGHGRHGYCPPSPQSLGL